MRIAMGPLAPPLHEQLGIDADAAGPHQRDADAISRLAVRGLLTDAETHKARKRLLKHMGALVSTPKEPHR